MTAGDALWLRLQPMLAAFAEKLATNDPALVHHTRRHANDAFVLRGYLSLMKDTQGDEVAVCIDVQNDDQHMVVTSDICLGNGPIVADGPSVIILLSDSERSVESALDDWLCELEQFLLKNEAAVVAGISNVYSIPANRS